MEPQTFLYAVLPYEKKELIAQKNVRVIKEFLEKREQLQNATEEEITRLEHFCKERTVNASIYQRLRQAIALKHELKRLELIKTALESLREKR